MKTLQSHFLTTSVLVAMLGMGQTALANEQQDEGYRHVNQVVWDKTGDAFEVLSASDIPDGHANLVFIRPFDKETFQTSANIGIDGNFQTSLQGGHYSQVMECDGNHFISVTITGQKNNELAEDSGQQVYIDPKQNHYFYVEVNGDTGATKLSKITEESALNVLGNKTEQTHQISRVVTQCKKPTAVVVTPPPVMIEQKPVKAAPVKTEIVEPTPEPPKVMMDKPITLDVLFRFDSDNVQPVYNQRLEDVANFMAQYPSVIARIEGHTDSVGASKYNMKLSQRRAQSVKDELVGKYGTEASRITTIGFGETKPIASNRTSQGRQQNRRVVAILSQK